MSGSYYADTFITLMLGWVRGVTNWIWRAVSSGSGSSARGFLSWFSSHWLQLTVWLVCICMAADWLVWIIRWRPYWLWFGKKRRVIDDIPATDARKTAKPRRSPEPQAQPASRRAQAPRFHSTALPRKEISVPEDLFDVVSAEPTAARASAHAQTPRQEPAPKPTAVKREKTNDGIEWFE